MADITRIVDGEQPSFNLAATIAEYEAELKPSNSDGATCPLAAACDGSGQTRPCAFIFWQQTHQCHKLRIYREETT